MRSPSVSICCLAFALAATAASAESEGSDETERWVPSFSFAFDLFGHSGTGSVESGEVAGPPLTSGPGSNGRFGCLVTGSNNRTGGLCPQGPEATNPPPAPRELLPDNSDADDNVLPMVVGAFELMTPRLVEGLAQPRLFTHVDLALAFGFRRKLAGVRSPEAFAAPVPITSVNDIQENTVVGQGSRANVQTDDFVLSAGAGVAFTARALGRTLRIKPSFEYIRQPVTIRGIVNRAVKLQTIATPGVLDPDEFRLISLTTKDSLVLHGLGGGLELEADTSRLGPLMLSVFIQGRAYYFPDTLDETSMASNEGFPAEFANWRFKLDPWAWRAGVGLRFRWLPERTPE